MHSVYLAIYSGGYLCMNSLHVLIAVWSDASLRRQAFSQTTINAQQLFICKYPPVFTAMYSFTQLSELDKIN